MLHPAPMLGLLFLLMPGSAAAAGSDLTLALSHPLRAGEMAWLQVQVGPLARGQQIEVTTVDGQLLGVISPFGVRRGEAAGTYTLPIPPEAIQGDRLAVRLMVSQFDGPARPPTTQEVLKVTLHVDPPQR
jgi:hypothetical protein